MVSHNVAAVQTSLTPLSVVHVKSAATRQDPPAAIAIGDQMVANMIKNQEDEAQTSVRERVRDHARSDPQMVLPLRQSDRRQPPRNCLRKGRSSNLNRGMRWTYRPILEHWTVIPQNSIIPTYILLRTHIPPLLLATSELANRILTQRFVNRSRHFCIFLC
jgi:hypothetical protein